MTKQQIIGRLAGRPGDSDRPLRIHLIGVAGSGMSGLAHLCLALGHRVSGSDRVRSSETDRLQAAGLAFACPHSAEVVEGAEVVIYSSAVRAGNEAFDAALRLRLPLVRRAEALAAILRLKRSVVVAGTHGKTTTSALLAHVLRVGGKAPSHYVGAEVPLLGANAHWDPAGEIMVAEGDESDGSLLAFHPRHAVILNIEEEHLDYYRDIHEIKALFSRFVSQVEGSIVYCAEDRHAREVCETASVRGIGYGWDRELDYSAGILRTDGHRTEFSAFHRGELLGRLELNIPGRHNVLNAMAVVALATGMGVEFAAIREALESFRGARRRFEYKYASARYTIVDDYGHHPSEVKATLETARGLDPGRLVVLFQPHRFSRTQRFAREFGQALRIADRVFVTGIYPASEIPLPGISGKTVVDAVLEQGGREREVTFVPCKSEAHAVVGAALRPGDLLVTLGAGDVHTVGARLAKDLEMLDALDEAMAGDHGRSRLYEPMSRHTTLRVGGPAQVWIEPHSPEAFVAAIRYARANRLPIRVIGRGSNLLVRDGGIPGLVVHLGKGEFGQITIRDNRIEAGVGVRMKTLAGAARAAGLGGFEWMEGIPGNIGGALRMNAGAMGSATFEQVVSVRCLNWDSEEIEDRAGPEFAAGYRSVPELETNFALSAIFAGRPASVREIESKLEVSKSNRKASQPFAASAGCIFKNPGVVPAGQLVDELGLKNHGRGGARVSDVHGNFIVNDGEAQAENVLALIDDIKDRAWQERGIRLDTEVQIIGIDKPEEDHFVPDTALP